MGSRYREMQIRTASPVDLVVQMYDGAIRHVRVAQQHHRAGRLRERSDSVSRALAIVAELRQSLNHEQGGEVASNLDALYVFVNERLVAAYLQDREESYAEALAVLEPLRAAWHQVAQQPPESQAAAAEVG